MFVVQATFRFDKPKLEALKELAGRTPSFFDRQRDKIDAPCVICWTCKEFSDAVGLRRHLMSVQDVNVTVHEAVTRHQEPS